MPRLRIWSADRLRRIAINITEVDNLDTILQRGCMKLNLLGVQLVANEDGTLITDDDDVQYYVTNDEPLLLLLENERWVRQDISDSHSSYHINKKRKIEEFVNLVVDKEDENGNREFAIVGEREIAEVNPQNSVVRNEEAVPLSLIEEDLLSSPNEEVFPPLPNENSANVLNLYLEDKKNSFRSWAEYKLPWIQIAHTDLLKCLSGTAENDTQSRIVQAVIEDMRFYNKPITFNVLRNVAVQFMTTFPKTFEGLDHEGNRLDNGYNTILEKLVNHNSYLNM